MAKTPAWQRKEGKNPSGGLNAKGRASYNKATGGNLKAPSKKVVGKRKKLDMDKDGKLTKKDFAMLRSKKKGRA